MSSRAARVRAPLHELREGRRRLDAATSSYLFRVLRLVVGDAFVVFDPAAHAEADASVVDPDPRGGEIDVGPPRPAAKRDRRGVTLVQALAKGDKLDAIVRDATELGATAVILARTARSVVHVEGPRAAARLERLGRVAEQAARQCGRVDPPRVVGPLAWPAALEAALDAPAVAGAFCLHPRAGAALGSLLVPALEREGALVFGVGPEGGLTDEELEQAAEAGLVTTSLGAETLRTETVAAAVLGAVRVLSEA